MTSPYYPNPVSDPSYTDIRLTKLQPLPFVTKLYRMVNDPKTDGEIYWDPTGLKVIIRNRDDFSGKVLPSYYKHNNWSSFVRQLNVYGFCTEQYSPYANDNDSLQTKDRTTYIVFHPQFKKDCSETLTNITRNIPGSSATKRHMLGTVADLSEGEDMKKYRENHSIEMDSINQLQQTVSTLQNKLDVLNHEIKYRRRVITQQQNMIRDMGELLSLFEQNSGNIFQETVNKPTKIQDLIERENDPEFSPKKPRLDTTIHHPNATKHSIYS